MSEQAKINVRVIELPPTKLKLLDLNARFMRHETFTRLVENIDHDGGLTSVPFAWRLHNDKTKKPVKGDDGEPIYEVLSGNHRVKAAIAAGLEKVAVMVTDDYLSPNRRRAIQLSHNAITGEDDPAILKTIYEGIDDVDMRVYAGLDDKTLELLAEVDVAPISEPNLQFQSVTLLFTPDEIEELENLWDKVKGLIAGSKVVWLARYADYDKFMDALETTTQAYRVRNIATAVMLILEVFSRHLTDLQDGYLDELGELIEKYSRQVPIETVLGSRSIASQTAAKLNRVVDKLLAEGRVKKDRRDQVLDVLIDEFKSKSE